MWYTSYKEGILIWKKVWGYPHLKNDGTRPSPEVAIGAFVRKSSNELRSRRERVSHIHVIVPGSSRPILNLSGTNVV